MLLSEIFFTISLILQSYVLALNPHTGGVASTEVLDRHGERIGFLDFQSNAVAYRLAEVPSTLKKLVLLAEDNKFYQHHGIDYLRSIKVLWDSVTSLRFKGGASTITQQWVRSRLNLPRKFWIKPIVMLLAVYVERRYEKDEIFAAYLNQVPFGGNTRGVGAAAEYYFAKPLAALGPSEFATLASLIRSPVGLASPDRLNELKKLRNHYLKLIQESNLSQTESLQLLARAPRSKSFGYIEMLSRLIKDRPTVIKSTLDSYLQFELEKIMEQELTRLEKKGVSHGAMMVMDARTGDVLVYIGSSNYFAKDGGQIDGLLVPRQPGSLIKAFTYGLGFDRGYTAASILPDTPGVFRSGAGMYRPRNYDERFTGPRRSREALANSLNLPAVMLVDDLTPERLYSALIDLGHTFPHPPDHYGVGLTLGNAELKPADLIQSFTAFSRLNSWVKARWIKNDKIQKFDNPISSESSYLVTDILKDPKARMEAFGERTALDVPFEMAAKTGTSTDYRDNWSVAWTSEHVVLTWVGNHNQQPMKRVSGITGAAPLTRMAMLKIYEKKYPSPFILPAPPKIFPICALSGEYAGAHCPRVLEEKFFANTPTQKCDWHQLVDIPMCGKHVLVHYPENFQSWAYEHGRDTESQLKQICPESTETYQIIVQDRVQLTYPLNGAIFAIDPDLPRESQRLPLKMSGGLKGIEWEVNGARFIPTKNDGTFDWPLERGKHVIRLISENQIQEQVEIVVR